MKITFIYADFPAASNSNKFNIGIAILSAVLKANGFETSLIHIHKQIDRNQFITELSAHSPDIIAFSYNSNVFKFIKNYIEWAEILDVPKIHGGIHPTIAPEECIVYKEIGILCRGEGESALLEFCEAIRDGKPYFNINNLWVKQGGKLIKNPIRPLIENLDELPFLDYTIFDYRHLADFDLHRRLVFMASRGCPYKCTYCCNHLLKKLYPNSNKYVRFKSAKRIIDEIKAGLEQFPDINSICFFDDTLTIDNNFFSEFSLLYKNEINLPYSCNDRVNQIDNRNIKLLKDSGCSSIALGIESGNAIIRNDIMKRSVSNQEIIYAFTELKLAGIKTSAFNIIGVPGETIDTVLDTIKLNVAASPNHYINAYFNAYNGTDLYNYCIENNIEIIETGASLFDKPTVMLPTIDTEQSTFFYKYFSILCLLYKLLFLMPITLQKTIDQLMSKLFNYKGFPFRFLNKIYIFDIASADKILQNHPWLNKLVHQARKK